MERKRYRVRSCKVEKLADEDSEKGGGMDESSRDSMATTDEDLHVASMETRNTQEVANKLVDGGLPLEGATALCWRFMTLGLLSGFLNLSHTGTRSCLDRDTGAGLDIILEHRCIEDHCLF